MDESFNLPIFYNGEELSFKTKLQILGRYTYKYEVKVYGQEVLFELDEERNLRAIINPSQSPESKKIPTDLLKTISDTIESIMK